jgi:rRNA-processing protein FCF1
VILDSNAIMMLFEFNINLEQELKRLVGSYKIIIPITIYKELKFLSEKGGENKRLKAKTALDLIKNYCLADASGKPDDSLISLAKKYNGIIVTNDKILRKNIKKNSLKTIYLRNKSKLVLE